MIRKKKAEPAEPVEQQKPVAVPEKTSTVLAEGVLFKGDFQSDEPMLIHGSVEGVIRSSSDVTLTGKSQHNGDITSDNLVVAGKAQGKIKCKSTVEIADKGKVEGTLEAARFIMSDYAVFEGSLKIKKPSEPKSAEASAAPGEKAPARP